jgi:hypothetical protein
VALHAVDSHPAGESLLMNLRPESEIQPMDHSFAVNPYGQRREILIGINVPALKVAALVVGTGKACNPQIPL